MMVALARAKSVALAASPTKVRLSKRDIKHPTFLPQTGTSPEWKRTQLNFTKAVRPHVGPLASCYPKTEQRIIGPSQTPAMLKPNLPDNHSHFIMY